MMKIAYMSQSFIPSRSANSIHVMKMCQALAEEGHQVTLFAPDAKNDMESGVADIYSFYDVSHCFHIVYLPWLWIKGRGYLYGYLAAQKARQLKPDIIYGRGIVACYFATFDDVPIMLESHAPETKKIPVWMFERLIQCPTFHQLIVITEALCDHYLTKYPCLEGKIQVVPDGADPVSSKTIPVSLPNAKSRLQIGYVGHLYQGKGMEIISRIASKCPWADFHVIGGMDKDIAYWKHQCKGDGNIFFHGFLPHSEVRRFILSFDVVLAPYQWHITVYGDSGDIGKWTSPLKLFEYMAAGKAIVCSDLPVLKEVLCHKKTALLVDPESPEAWEQALGQLRDDIFLRERLGLEAQEIFNTRYTWQARARQILSKIQD